MNRATWTADRALMFARGLYHVAACDGLDPREIRALNVFMQQVGLAIQADQLAAEPFDYIAAGELLESSWLRRTFVQACRLMVQVDGVVSDAERDTLRALAAALGVGERVALADLDGPAPPPDALYTWVAQRTVDFVSWEDARDRRWFWAFPHPRHPLAEGAALEVNEGQALVVRLDDDVTDVLGPGTHAVSPTVLPGLAKRRGWAGGPIEAELLFVRTGPSPRLRWGTVEPVVVHAPGLGAVPIRVYGRCSLRVRDPRAVVRRMARASVPDRAETEARLRRIVAGRFRAVLGGHEAESEDALLGLLNDLDGLVDLVAGRMKASLAQSGLKLERFAIENLTGPLELGLRPTSSKTRALTLTGVSAPDAAAEKSAGPAHALRACDECLAPVPVKARFCSKCGTAQRRACAGCGADTPVRARFCPSCGKPQRKD